MTLPDARPLATSKSTTTSGNPQLPQTSRGGRQSVTIFGSTGSIGCQTLDILNRHKDRFSVTALTAQNNVDQLAEQAIRHGAKHAVIGDERKYADLKSALSGSDVVPAAGEQAVSEAALLPADCFMAAIVGVAGLNPTYLAAEQGTRIALANKECLVSAGDVFLQHVRRTGATLLPVDSEHSAAFQALGSASPSEIRKVTLTASGGPFRTWSAAQLAQATPDDAVNHPTWKMGQKISVDSATLMNKGLELVEALHLFPVEPQQLDVVIHPQSVIHSIVSFADGSNLAQLSPPDMRTPIAYSLSWPDRIDVPTRALTVEDLASMTFEKPDENRFSALRIARDVLNEGGWAGTVFNAANEIAVEAFLSGAIGFMSITELVEETLNEAVNELQGFALNSLPDVFHADETARRLTRNLIASRGANVQSAL